MTRKESVASLLDLTTFSYRLFSQNFVLTRIPFDESVYLIALDFIASPFSS